MPKRRAPQKDRFRGGWLATIGFLIALVSVGRAQTYLSELLATKDDPIFTTYAAPLSCSEFLVDEGYHLRFYEETEGIDFVTDKGGRLALAFRIGNDVRYRLDQMHTEPVIIASYSDLVKYQYQPFASVAVQVHFQVFSSRLALQDVSITNVTEEAIKLDVFPFLWHAKGLKRVSISPDRRHFTFRHAEPPDSWTTGHGIPYVDSLDNVLLISEPADAFGAYLRLGELKRPRLSWEVALQDYCVQWGNLRHADGTRCQHAPPLAQQIVLHNGSTNEILTETAPRWGSNDPNIPGNGSQACELGNFQHPPVAVGDSFTVILNCLATHQQGRARGTIAELPAVGGIRADVQLHESTYPDPPQNLDVHFSIGFHSAVLSWDVAPGCLYNVYRRCGSPPGRYDLLADSLRSGGYLDLGLNPDSSYAYVVIATDTNGAIGAHSQEVGTAGRVPFFADIYHERLSNAIPLGPSQVVAFQKSILLQPGQTRHLRIVRGVVESGRPLRHLVQVCDSLLTYDMEQALLEDERWYARIPRLQFDNPDYELMYWSAFSMMRQCMLPPEGECSYNYYLFSREPTWGWGHGGQVFHESLAMLAYAFMDPESAQGSQRVYAERMASRPDWPPGYIPYRVGPYLNEVNYYAGEHSSSAPWFNWENWEIFKISGDTTFLADMYEAGGAFHDFWIEERDDDRDGLCEWGGHAFWESVRDYNVIWDLLGGWADPHSANKVEALDLNCELIVEEKSLAEMAEALGRREEAELWRQRAQARAHLVNQFMWDAETKFYYHVEKNSHSFTYWTTNDLKRKEIIGFLPLWAGIASQEQASYLVQELANVSTFNRPFGIPLLAYNDPYDGYDSHSVYPEWNFLVFRGLLNYGYLEEAEDLAKRLFDGVVQTLQKYHDFYESYYVDASRPSDSWLHTYFWTGVVARMLLDLKGWTPTTVPAERGSLQPGDFKLRANFPNPFNARTVIRYYLPLTAPVSLRVYSLNGAEVRCLAKGIESPGWKARVWDGADGSGVPVGSGVYVYRLSASGRIFSRKMLLLR